VIATATYVSRPREMATMNEIIAHWRTEPISSAPTGPALKSAWIGWGEPFCFACGWLPPVEDGLGEDGNEWSWRLAASWLDRAHLRDHWSSGDGSASNLVPLCHLCHEQMTDAYDDREDALAWVVNHPECEWEWQMWTDSRLRKKTPNRSTTHYCAPRGIT
jgi:hypothetical protein